jgi:hypothetical protein
MHEAFPRPSRVLEADLRRERVLARLVDATLLGFNELEPFHS